MRSSIPDKWNALRSAVHVWQCNPDGLGGAALERQCLGWLTPQEWARRGRLRTSQLRHVYLATRGLCRVTLSRYAGVDPAAWKFVEGRHGKPAIAQPAEFAGLRFNLTHTEGLIACVVSRVGEVGVDAEETTREVDVDRVAKHFFSSGEQAALAKISAGRRASRFFQQWVLKEAYLKGRGLGLARSPDSFTIEVDDDGEPLPLGNWQFGLHRPDQRHIAAVAVRRRRGGDAVKVQWFMTQGLFDAGAAVE